MILIGSDPELFVKCLKTGKFISAHDLIPGTKQEPYPVQCGAIQVDGVAAEFNIHPTETADEFLYNIDAVIAQLGEIVRQKGDYILVADPTVTFDKEYFKSLPEEVRQLGCKPDYNAYTGKENYPPETTEPFRTGAGHIHIGFTEFMDIYDPDFLQVCRELTKQLDVALYYPSLSWDSDTKRRTLYGKIGSFRPKHYGLEYRPLSNAFLRDPELIRFVFNTTKWASELYLSGVKLFESKPSLPEKYL